MHWRLSKGQTIQCGAYRQEFTQITEEDSKISNLSQVPEMTANTRGTIALKTRSSSLGDWRCKIGRYSTSHETLPL
ncbi:hypothetical protein EVAR_3969_1 [Eumeta japonica]|uniref:Uncharacterized protein n=1 Tax=Eumeta variegata TaxID=151549 RepID=A0A4C1SQY9_EUMVA|nr:hypothetical protein EVAR_3969_1 [Eumeta japonica]